MNETKLTPEVLRNNGFREELRCGHICFVRGNVALIYNIVWIPCTLDFGQPLCQQSYVNTWEELERLMQEGNIN